MSTKNSQTFDSISKQEGLSDLVAKYSGAIPRYTSYPTAVEFQPSVDSKKYRAALDAELEQLGHKQSTALYVHVPFCSSLCYFCACNKKIVKDDSDVLAYLRAVERELSGYCELLRDRMEIKHFHWGGGTPNFLSIDATKKLFQICAEHFPSLSSSEMSIEVDPRTLTEEHIHCYSELGFSRISAGVQDFTPAVQQAINRIQSYESTERLATLARELKFRGVNLDLIYGLPNQSIETFSDTIKKVLQIRPDRIALYGYAHVTWKTKVQKTLQRHQLPSPEDRLALFTMAIKELSEAGYVYIGMDHFALPTDSLYQSLTSGNLSRNFMGYSTYGSASVLGIGVSSVSCHSTVIAQNESNLEAYINDNSNDDRLKIVRGVLRSDEDLMRGELIESILCQEVIDIAKFESKWNLSFYSYFADALAELEQMQSDGLLELNAQSIEVKPLGRLFARNIAAVFDSYLPAHKSGTRQVFSQSV